MPRITEQERTPDVRAMIDAIAGIGTMNVDHHHVLMTFAQYPALTHPFLDLNRHLLTTSTLPVRLRQIAILRVAWRNRVAYMWASHLRLSLSLGLDDADFAAVREGADATRWTADEFAIVAATDQLVTTSDLDEATWARLEAFLDRRQVMDLIFTVGAYVLIGMAFNAMRIQREPELIALAGEHPPAP